MHNIHFLTIKANSPKEACQNAEYAIEDWGTDNNWRRIMGCISEKDEVYKYDESSHYDFYHYNTIEKLNKLMNNHLKFDPLKYLVKVKGTIELFLSGEDVHQYDWYTCKEIMNAMYEKSPWLDKEFDILNDECYSWKLDEFGTTKLDSYDDGETTYVVLVDMHS